MLRRFFTYALSISLAGAALAGCGDNDNGEGEGDAAVPDAMSGPDAGGGADAGTDAGVDYDLTIESIAGGRIEAFPGSTGITGAAHLVRMAEATRAELYVEGLEPATEHVAHVHRLPCDQAEGGPHYKHDPSIEAEEEDNEIWLRFTTDSDGKGVASTQQLGPEKKARMDAGSIVVHDPENPDERLACASLFFDDEADAEIELQGAFTAVEGAPAGDQDVGGSVTVTVSAEDDETFINFDLEGLDETATYGAHVHELPCEVDDAGAHYKRDITVEEEQEDNEIWPDPAMQEQSFPHALRYDAQSVVIHRVEAGSPRVACANLVRMTEIPEYVTSGEGEVLPGVDPQFDAIEATATLTRRKDGTTAAALTVTGLPDGVADFGAHVHAGTCALTPPGGPHYKLDPAVTAEVEANEIWLDFDADAGGEAMSSEDKEAHLARPDAISVIVHVPGGDDRLVCIELR
jgi:hypothetical protein